MIRKAISTLVGMVILVIGVTSSVNAGNDFVVVNLRTDAAAVYRWRLRSIYIYKWRTR